MQDWQWAAKWGYGTFILHQTPFSTVGLKIMIMMVVVIVMVILVVVVIMVVILGVVVVVAMVMISARNELAVMMMSARNEHAVNKLNKLLTTSNIFREFYVFGSVHRWSVLITVQRDATQSSLFIILQVHSTCFGCQPHPSSGVHNTVTTASDTSHIFCAAWPRWREVAAQYRRL